jgi:putative ribosome biogenesis GTPase RsgA
MLDLASLDKKQLANHFPEFDGIECAFPDCTHMPKEKDCQASEVMSESRLESYRTLFES